MESIVYSRIKPPNVGIPMHHIEFEVRAVEHNSQVE
jgi:hypothetical protein